MLRFSFRQRRADNSRAQAAVIKPDALPGDRGQTLGRRAHLWWMAMGSSIISNNSVGTSEMIHAPILWRVPNGMTIRRIFLTTP